MTSEDHTYANTPTWLECPAIEQEGGSTLLLRGDVRYPVNGSVFPANIDSAERAQITSAVWIGDYIDRALFDLRRRVRGVFGRDLTTGERARLINAVFDARAAGSLPYDMNLSLQVFVEIREAQNEEAS